MPRVPFSTLLVRLWHARGRLVAAVIALYTGVRYWPGWIGWAVGAFAAVGLVLFEFQRWWDYLSRGEPESTPPPPQVSGSARFRERGTTRVRLLAVGEHPNLVAMTIRLATGLGDAKVSELMAGAPTTLPLNVSLRSAGHVVDALRASGARAHLLVNDTSAGRT